MQFCGQMKSRILFSMLAVLVATTFLTSCEKKESPIVLPPKGDALPGRVNMGETYETQVFYDLESNSVVKTSAIASWDLAFESGKNGFHIWMNGGNQVLVYNTHHNNGFSSFMDVPAGMKSEDWRFDDPSGIADSTGVGNWKDANDSSKLDIYLVKINDTAFYKFQVLAVDDKEYTIRYSKLDEQTSQTLTLAKDDKYNYTYFSFRNGVTMPEPPKATWDIVFTRYRYIYRELENFPYMVNGVLLNPNATNAAVDSTSDFAGITFDKATAMTASTARDIIGFDWKAYNFQTGRYEVNAKKTYVLHTQRGMIFKLRFLDFYGPTGVKGSPGFESQRLQ